MDVFGAAQRYYSGHDDDVVSLARHPGGELAASGQVASQLNRCCSAALVSERQIDRQSGRAAERETARTPKARRLKESLRAEAAEEAATDVEGETEAETETETETETELEQAASDPRLGRQDVAVPRAPSWVSRQARRLPGLQPHGPVSGLGRGR